MVSWAASPPDGIEVPDAVISRALHAALDHGGHTQRVVDVVFVDKRALASMHGQFLGDPSETDVITFDLRTDGDPIPGDPEPGDSSGERAAPLEADGELYVSVDRALESSAERGVSFERELVLYVVHGALHLCGFDDHDPDERAAMRAAERSVMGRLGYPEDLAPHDL